MVRRIDSLILIVISLILSPLPAVGESVNRLPIQQAVIDEGSVYCVTELSEKRIRTYDNSAIWYKFSIFKAPLSGAAIRKINTNEYWYSLLVGAKDEELFHWRVCHGHFWCSPQGIGTQRIHTDELPLFDTDGGVFGSKYRARHKDKDTSWHFGPPELNGKADNELFTDFLPTGPTTGLMFVRLKTELRVWEGKAIPNEDQTQSREWILSWKELKEQRLPAIQEPFQVYAGKDHWFFLTRSSKLFVSRNEKQGGPGMALLWKDEDSPIKAMITDNASNKTYAFTAPRPVPRRADPSTSSWPNRRTRSRIPSSRSRA